jgi:RNA polymerase sigma-70 factor (ECF subfamily)
MRWRELYADFVAEMPAPASVPPATFEALLATAHEAWPTFDVLAPAFARHLGRAAARWVRVPDDASRLHAADLALAWACLGGDTRAITALTERHRGDVVAACRWAGADASLADDVWTDLLAELTAAVTTASPGLAGYAGSGPLRAYLRAIAVRKAIHTRSQADSEPVDDELPDLADDPAVTHLRAQYAGVVEEALRAAVAGLTPREKTLLLQHHADGLGIDKLAQIHGVHRATAARWVASARRTVLDTCRAQLSEQLQLDPAQVESIVRLVRSQIHVSVIRCLTSP